MLIPVPAAAQATFNVGNEAQLRAALSSAVAGDRIVFTADITLSAGDLPDFAASIVVDGAGHRLLLARSDFLQITTAGGTTSAIAPPIIDEHGLFPSPQSGSWSLQKDGAGTLVLSGANAYSGGTSIFGGTVSVSNGTNLGTGVVGLQNDSTLAITASSVFDHTLFISETPSIAVAAGQSVTWNGRISDLDATGSLEVTGGGTLMLTNTANDYSGGTLVTGGSTLAVADNAALGDAAGGVTLGNATSGGTLAINSSAPFLSSRAFVLGAGGGTFDIQGASTANLSGVISGGGALTKTGAGTLTLSGANTYTGPTTVTAGVLQAGPANVFGVNGAMTVRAGATLNLNDFNQTVGSLAGAGNVTLGSATLTTGGNNATTLFSGVLSGTGGLTKGGTGALVLTGANTYTGGTLVSGGSLVGNSTSLQGAIANNALVVFDQAANGTYAGVMSGAGTLTKTGAGALTLTGANSYSGGTIVSAGTLIGNTTSLQGAIANNAQVVFDQAANGTYAGVMSGAGTLTKSGAGTLTLSGANTFAGATNVTGGVLRAGASNVFGVPGIINLSGGTTLDLNNFNQTVGSVSGGGNITLGSGTLTTGSSGGNAVLSGAISGTGSLVKTGSGTFTLTGANTYSGGTTVLDGTLAGNTSGLQGNIVNNALVQFDQSADGTYAGSMSGSGMLAKTGTGTLTLTGANTYTGGTLIAGGSLAGTTASLRGTIVNNASLRIDASTDGSFNGVLAGFGSFLKTGAGTLSLSGSHSLTGTMTVANGTLALNGFLGGTVSVSPGAALRANGTLAGSVDVFGSLFAVPPPGAAAGPSIAAVSNDPLASAPYLTIGGNLTALPGSVIGMPLGPGTNPTILVGGQATLNGTQLNFTADVPQDQRSVSFLALTALNGLTMTNTSATTQSPALVPLLKQDRTSLFVMLLNYAVPLGGVVETPNAIRVGEVIDEIKLDATGDQAAVIRELTALDDASLDAALESIAGEIHASSVQLPIIESAAFTDIVRNQVTARAHDADEEGADGWGGQKIRWWTQFTGEYATFGESDAARGAIARFGSGVGGMDLRLSNRWLFGAGGGFGAGNMGMRGLSGDTDFQAPRAFGYVGYRPKGFGLRGGGSASRVSYKKQRRISFAATLPPEFGVGLLTGGVDREAASEEAGLVSDTWSEYDDSVEVKTYKLDWMIGFRQARFSRGGFAESGADALSLAAAEQILTLRHTDVKLHLWRRSGTYRPYVETMFRRELTDGATDLTLRFADEPDSDFTVEGVPVPGNIFAGRGGMTMMTRLGAVTVEYAITKASGQTRQTGDVRVRFR